MGDKIVVINITSLSFSSSSSSSSSSSYLLGRDKVVKVCGYFLFLPFRRFIAKEFAGRFLGYVTSKKKKFEKLL